jgi:hypothetical protein
MWPVDDQIEPPALNRAIRQGATYVPRLEVWTEGARLTSSAPIIPGSGVIEASWRTGITRTFGVSVPADDRWLRYLKRPALELRPYLGVRVSSRQVVDFPMGVFPWQPGMRSTPRAEQIDIRCDDYWSWLLGSGRPAHEWNYGGMALESIAQMIADGGITYPVVEGASDRYMPYQLLDKTRHDVIADWCQAVGYEALVDRSGRSRLRPVVPLGAPTTEAVRGWEGTAASISEGMNRAEMKNQVATWSTAQNVVFPEQVAQIDDPDHPAHASKIGPRRLEQSSPLYGTAEHAKAGAETLLAKHAALARVMTYERLPDPSTDPGDSMLGQLMDGSTEVQQVDVIVTPFGRGLQRVSSVATPV